MLRILHVLSQRPDSTGSGIYLQGMIEQAGLAGHENRMLAGVGVGQESDLDCIEAACCGYVFFDSPELPFPVPGMTDIMPYSSSVFGRLGEDEIEAYEAAFAVKLSAAVADFSPDLIHCHHLWLATSLTRRLFPGIPVVATCHGTDLRQFRNCAHLRGRVLAGCSGLDAVMALSHAQRGEIIELYGLDPAVVEVVGAGFNDSLFKPGLKATAAPVRLAYAGKLTRPKGVIWMLRALAGLADRSWIIDLVGGGSGDQKREILEFAYEMDGRVLTHGAVPQYELARILSRTHVFILPSFFEGLPLVLLEAMACGCRLVTTALPGVAELFRGYQGADVAQVRLPRLIGVDTPHPDDEEEFVLGLRDAIAGQIDAVFAKTGETDDRTAAFLAGHTWAGVFERVRDVYARAMDRRTLTKKA